MRWPWRRTPAKCQVELASAELPYLDLIRPGRVNDGTTSVDRGTVGEWRVALFGRMTYEMFGARVDHDTLLEQISAAAVTYLRYGGALEHARLSVGPAGNLTLDLPVGAPSTAFVLMLERRLLGAITAPPERLDDDADRVSAWLARQRHAWNWSHPERFPRDAAE